MNTTIQPPGRFEERLLAELRRVVEEGAIPAGAEPLAAQRPELPWRRRRLVLAGGLAAAAAVASVAGLALNGGDNAAWAVTSNGDGTVTVKINSLRDADGLERKLTAAGVPALVQYLPAGKACGVPVGEADPETEDPGAPPAPAGGRGAAAGERGLSEAPSGAGDFGLEQAGAPATGGQDVEVQTGMRVAEDGGVEFTIEPPASRAQTLMITSQTLPAVGGATVDGAALSVEYRQGGEARPCRVVDAPE
jgi:hypothetical protein